MTDFDGDKLTRKGVRAKYGVRYVPTFQFFPDGATPLKTCRRRSAKSRASPAIRRPCYYFLAVFHYVREKGYEKGRLRDFLKDQS